MTTWSSTSTSSSRPAAIASAVRCRSSGLGRRVARRVVVAQHDARCVQPHGVPEQLADPNQGRRDVADVDGRDAQDDVLRVEAQDAQLLTLEAAHVDQQAIRDVTRRADRPATRRPLRHGSTSQLERGREPGRLRRAETGHGGDLRVGRPREGPDAQVAGEELLREIGRAPAAGARAEDHGDQLRGRQPAGTAECEPLARSLGGGQVANRPARLAMHRRVAHDAVALGHRPHAPDCGRKRR